MKLHIQANSKALPAFFRNNPNFRRTKAIGASNSLKNHFMNTMQSIIKNIMSNITGAC